MSENTDPTVDGDGNPIVPDEVAAKPSEKDRNKAYTKAAARLREAHQEEFDRLLAEEYEAIGAVPRRRKTEEEKAAEAAAREEEKQRRKREKAEEQIRKHEAAIAELRELAGEAPI